MFKFISAPLYEATGKDKSVKCSCVGGAMKFVLPPLSDGENEITIMKTDSSANAITVYPKRRESLYDGTLQVETATVVGTVTKSGNAAVVLTAAGLPGSPLTLSVAVAKDDTAAVVAGKIRTALRNVRVIGDPDVGMFDISGSGVYVVLTKVEYSGNDSTLNLSVDNDTSEGLTQAASSANTTAGVAVTISSQNEYAVLINGGASWQVVDSGGVNKTETLTNKTLTAPVITSPDLTFAASAHNYSGAHADWTLSAAEAKTLILTPTNADQAVNIVAPATAGKVFIVYNGTGQNVVIKVAAQTGITIANTKTAIVRCNGTDYVRVTADA